MGGSERFREETHFFSLPITVLFIAVAVYCIKELVLHPSPQLVPVAIIIFSIPLLFGKMVTTVDPERLVVRFGYLKLIKRSILLKDIVSSEAVTYGPLRNFGGWGIRMGRFRGERTGCLSLKGTKGVLLTLSKKQRTCLFMSKKLIIASEEPEKLKKAL